MMPDAPDLATLLDLDEDGLLLVSRRGRSRPSPEIVWCNGSFEAFSGFRREAIKGRRLRFLLAAPSAAVANLDLPAAVGEMRPFRGHVAYATHGGDTLVALTEGRAVPGDSGHYLLRVRVRQPDQTAPSASELGRQAAFLSGLVDACLYLLRRGIDGGFRLEWIDGSIERLIGVSAADAVARGGVARLVADADRPRFLRHVQALLAGRKSTVEYRIRTISGRLRWVRDIARPQFEGQDDLVTAVVGAVASLEPAHDETQRRRQARRAAALLAQSLPALVVLLDSAGFIDWASEGGATPVADRFRGAVGQSLDSVLAAERADDWRDWLDLALTAGQPVAFEMPWADDEGSAAYAVRMAPLDDDLAAVLVLPASSSEAPHAEPPRGAIDRDADVIMVVDNAQTVLHVLGLPATHTVPAAESPSGRAFGEYFSDSAQRRRVLEAVASACAGGAPEPVLAQLAPPGLEPVVRYWRAVAVRRRSGDTEAVVVFGTSPGGREVSQGRFADPWLTGDVGRSSYAVLVSDEAARVVACSDATGDLFGLSGPELLDAPLDLLLTAGPTVGLNLPALLRRCVAGHSVPREMFARRRTGEVAPVEMIAVPLAAASPSVLLILRDASLRRQTEETVRSLAYLDPLTGLPNRLLFQDRVHQAIERGRRNRQMLAVMLVDLDRFKLVNDSLGLEKGDQMLRLVAERLSRALRRSDTVARLGGDEFMVLLSTTTSAEATARVAQKILDALQPAFSLNGHEVTGGASIGIAVFPDDGDDPDTLIKNADAALSQAKEQGRNHFKFYTNDMNARAFGQLMLETQLRRALEREELTVHYQPLVDLSLGRMVGVEALLRWAQPDLGMVSPAEFIPVAEESGLIVPIGEWVLRRACADVRAWHRMGFDGLRLAVNLSGRQFQDRNLAGAIARALSDTGFPAGALELELTESVIMRDAAESAGRLRELTALGISLAVDDFGTGYSSLSYLRSFPIRSLKIDRSFVRDVDRDPNGAAIVQAIIALGRSLGLNVVAEGVETRAQMETLQRYGCHEMQGFLFSRPVPAADLLVLLRDRQDRWD
jgi:diguanylate cyclase (GGDEF)-like protein/PAS domain S-box-containing protein